MSDLEIACAENEHESNPRLAVVGDLCPFSWGDHWRHPGLGAAELAKARRSKPTIPYALGMVSTDTPFYDDGETTIYQVKRPVSLPIIAQRR